MNINLSSLIERLRRSFATKRRRRAPRSGDARSVRLMLQPLEARLVPSATIGFAGGVLTVNEQAAHHDFINVDGAGSYNVVDSSTSTSPYNGVTSIVFNAGVSNVIVEFTSGSSADLTGGLTVNGVGAANALTVLFDDSFNVRGSVTVADNGVGSSQIVYAGNDDFGSLNVSGGAAVSGGNTFATVHGSFNGSVSGTLVDLGGAQTTGSVNIKLGGDGGYVLTDYNLDLGNPAKDGANASANVVGIGGGLSVTDLVSRSDDLIELYRANVSGNVTIDVSSLTNEEDIDVQNFTIGGNLTVNISVTGGETEEAYIINSSIDGSASINESSQDVYEANASFNDSTVKDGLTVTQPAGDEDVLESYGAPGYVIGGAVNVTQGATDNGVYFCNWPSINGSVTTKQTGVYENSFEVNNSSVLGSVTISQPATSVENDAYVEYAAINSGNVSIVQGASTDVSYAYVEDDTIGGCVAINQARTSGGYDEAAYVCNDSINGSVSGDSVDGATFNFVSVFIVQSANCENVVQVYNATINGNVVIYDLNQGSYENNDSINTGDTINRSVTIYQAGGSFEDCVDIYDGDSIKGGISVTQSSSAENEAYVENSSVNGAAAINQLVRSSDNDAYVENCSIGDVAIDQGGSSNESNASVDNDRIDGFVAINQAVTPGGEEEDAYVYNDSINGSGNGIAVDGATFSNVSVVIAQSAAYENLAEVFNASINGSVVAYELNPTSYEDYVDINNGDTINRGVTIYQTGGSSEADANVYTNVTIHGGIGIKQVGVGDENLAYVENASVPGGGVVINQLAAGSDEAYIEETSSIAQGVTIAQSATYYNEIDVEQNSSIAGMLSVTEGPGYNAAYLQSGAKAGGLSLNLGYGFNYVDICDTTITGPTTMNLGIAGLGDNEVYIGATNDGVAPTTLTGAVAVHMGEGTNAVQLGTGESTDFVAAGDTFTANAGGVNSDTVGGHVTGNTPKFVNF